MTPPMTTTETLLALAGRLSPTMRRNLMALPTSRTWLMACELKGSGATGSGLTLLTVTHGLVERRWCSWGADRGQNLQAGEGYEYRLTEAGVEARAAPISGVGK